MARMLTVMLIAGAMLFAQSPVLAQDAAASPAAGTGSITVATKTMHLCDHCAQMSSGKCPKCGMDMKPKVVVPKTASPGATVDSVNVQHNCDMCMVKDSPGKCAVCGADMTQHTVIDATPVGGAATASPAPAASPAGDAR